MKRNKHASLSCAHPLAWPKGYDRTLKPDREKSRFRAGTINTALDELETELRILGAHYIKVSTDLPVKSNGKLYASLPEPHDPGVAVYFDLDGTECVMACDRWNRLRDNLLAISRTIGALRSIERYGSSSTMKQAFSAFQALPADVNDWVQTLGVSQGAAFEECKKAYRKLALELHPDHGGNETQMNRLNQAWEACKIHFGGL